MRSLRILLFTTLLATVFFSCNKDADDPFNGGNSNFGIIDADINGYQWSAGTGYASQITTNTLELYGSQGSSHIRITLYPYNGIQTYSLGATNKAIFVDSVYQYDAINGSITVTSDTDEKVQGTFSFTAVQNGGSVTININNGTFDLYKQ